MYSDKTIAVEDGVRELLIDSKLAAVLEWLPSINFPAQKDDLLAKATPGTGSSFLLSPEFIEWEEGSRSTLYCSGPAGAGKTIMSCLTIAHLEEKYQPVKRDAICYLFCNYKVRNDRLSGSFCASLLAQLLRQAGSCPLPVERLWERHMRQGSPDAEEYTASLRSALRLFQRTFFVIDALDEFIDRSDSHVFIKIILELTSSEKLKIMVTSRPIPEISRQFSGCPAVKISATRNDLETYLEDQCALLEDAIRTKEGLCKEIREAIISASDGM